MVPAIDLLSRNTTASAAMLPVAMDSFGPVVFHDGQGLMVPVAAGVRSLEDLRGKASALVRARPPSINDAFAIPYTPIIRTSIRSK